MRDGKMLVTGELTDLLILAMLTTLEVSATSDIWDTLRSVVRDNLASEVSFFELDYQPLQK
jgi:hypothetical protein